LLRLHPARRVREAVRRDAARRRPRECRHRDRRERDRARAGAHRDLRAVGEPPLRSRDREAQGARMSAIGNPNGVAIGSFLGFVGITLGITWWAARRTRTTSEFFAAGSRISAAQNGFALAGDYMSAASFLG